MNLISNIVFLLGSCVELVSLVICADIFRILPISCVSKKRIVFSLAAYVAVSVIIVVLNEQASQMTDFFAMILYYLRFILTLLIMYGRLNSRCVYLIFLCDLSISLLSSSLSCIAANITDKNNDDVSPYIMLAIRILVLTAVLIAYKKSNIKRNSVVLSEIPNYIFLMLILAIICLSALSSLIGFQTDNILFKENMLTAIVILLTVIFIIIVVSLIFNVMAKQHFNATSQMMEKQVELQINHFNEVEKMNAEIKRFRHDYLNHLQSILSLVQMNECSMAEAYILKLNKLKNETQTTIFNTGNTLADAILTNKASLLDKNGRIDYSGIMPLTLDNVDLCIILTNALDNAIEACKELSKPYVISILAKKQQGYFILSIKNPTVRSENFYDIPATTKAEKNEHGMGLHNIESVVEKYEGQMKIKCENGFFELTLTMKI